MLLEAKIKVFLSNLHPKPGTTKDKTVYQTGM